MAGRGDGDGNCGRGVSGRGTGRYRQLLCPERSRAGWPRYRRAPARGETPPYAERLVTADKLDEVLPLADVVVLCLPGTRETAALFSARRLALMKRGAFLLNGGEAPPLTPRRFATPCTAAAWRGGAGCYRPGTASRRSSPVDAAERRHHAAYFWLVSHASDTAANRAFMRRKPAAVCCRRSLAESGGSGHGVSAISRL